MLTFDSYESGDVLVLTIEENGDLDNSRQSGNREWLYQTVQSRPTPLFAVNLGEVSYLSSADFGILISLKRRVDSRRGKLVLFQVSSFIVDTLNTMRLGAFFPMAEDLRGALSLLQG